MTESNDFWDLYWEMRLQPMENLGKRAAILAASDLIRSIARQDIRPLRLLELGCGEGQIIGTLLNAHSQVCSSGDSVGVDYNARSLVRCQQDFPGFRRIEGDFTDPDLLAQLGRFDVVLLVNALHEVYSDTFSPELDEIDIPLAKQRVKQALAAATGCLGPAGWLVLFDGLEPPGDPFQVVRIRFQDSQAFQEFKTFVQEYQPFHINYHQASNPLQVELSRRDFTRYITKSIFLAKPLWKTERLQSYQYFTEAEFRSTCAALGLKISELRLLTVNEDKWRRKVEIITDGEIFPDEHVLILAQQDGCS